MPAFPIPYEISGRSPVTVAAAAFRANAVWAYRIPSSPVVGQEPTRRHHSSSPALVKPKDHDDF